MERIQSTNEFKKSLQEKVETLLKRMREDRRNISSSECLKKKHVKKKK